MRAQTIVRRIVGLTVRASTQALGLRPPALRPIRTFLPGAHTYRVDDETCYTCDDATTSSPSPFSSFMRTDDRAWRLVGGEVRLRICTSANRCCCLLTSAHCSDLVHHNGHRYHHATTDSCKRYHLSYMAILSHLYCIRHPPGFTPREPLVLSLLCTATVSGTLRLMATSTL
jgi:hypothetical protein